MGSCPHLPQGKVEKQFPKKAVTHPRASHSTTLASAAVLSSVVTRSLESRMWVRTQPAAQSTFGDLSLVLCL